MPCYVRMEKDLSVEGSSKRSLSVYQSNDPKFTSNLKKTKWIFLFMKSWGNITMEEMCCFVCMI